MSKIISICAEGDSLSYVIGGMFWRAMNGGNAISYVGGTIGVRFELRKSYGVHVVANHALSGRRLTNLETQAATTDALIRNVPGVNGRPIRDHILCVSVGTNVSDANPTTFAASVGAYCAARKAAGWHVILCTIMSRTDGIIANFDSSYQQPYNAIIRTAGWAAANGVDLICDIASNAELGSSGASDNVAYAAYWSGDKIHPSATGYTLAAVTYKASIDSLIATRMAGF